MPNAADKIHTGVPFLDRMLSREKNIHGSIPIPDGRDHSRMNVLVKGETSTGKTILSTQIAVNLMNRVVFEELKGDKIHHKQNIGKPVDPPIVPLYFTFEQSMHEIKRNMEKMFSEAVGVLSDGRFHLPFLFGLRKYDVRNPPLISDLANYISFIQNYFLEWRGDDGHPSPGKDLEKRITDRFPEMETNVAEVDRVKLQEILGKKPRFVVFIDNINVFFEQDADRNTLHNLLALSEQFGIVMFLLCEDYCSSTRVEFQFLAKTLEFQSDIIIHLTSESKPYFKNFIEIAKNRYSKHILGRHFFKIFTQDHSSYELDRRVGIGIYLSIHAYLAECRDLFPSDTRYSGISHIDFILSGEKAENHCLTGGMFSNSFVLISGEKGGHKLPLAFNLLLGGLLPEKNGANPKRPVLIFSLQDEDMIDFEGIARSFSTTSKFSDFDIGPYVDQFRKIVPSRKSADKKGANTRRNRKIHILQYSTRKSGKETPTLIQASCSPGNLTIEEMLFFLQAMIIEYGPSRVLIDNTSLLRMRFLEIYNEKMSFAAIVSLLKSYNIMSILIDVTGEGSDRKLSYSLRGMADYIFKVDSFESFVSTNFLYRRYLENSLTAGAPHVKLLVKAMPEKLKSESVAGEEHSYTFSFLSISNVRNKVYSTTLHGITVRPKKGRKANELFVFDIEGLPRIGFEDADW